MLFDVAGKRRDLASIHVELVRDLLGKSPGKRLDLPHGIKVLLEPDALYVYKGSYPLREPDSAREREPLYAYKVDKKKLETDRKITMAVGEEKFEFELISPKQCDKWKNDCIKYFNYDRIKNELYLRTRKHGDYLVIDQLGSKKLLRRYFIDQKIPLSKRDQVFLLAEENHILWVTGGRISEAYKVTDKTGKVLRVTYSKEDGGNQRYE